jgi:hypothetical protein
MEGLEGLRPCRQNKISFGKATFEHSSKAKSGVSPVGLPVRVPESQDIGFLFLASKQKTHRTGGFFVWRAIVDAIGTKITNLSFGAGPS